LSRILLICPEPLGHGQPAGVGVRFLEIARVLRDDGHAITILSPDAAAIEGCKGDYIHPRALMAHSAINDAAVVQGHVGNALFLQGKELPTVVDLYDPYIVENFHYYATQGGETFVHDHVTFTRGLLRGDFYLCASEAQRLFYLGAMMAAGRLHPAVFENDPHLDTLLRIAPFGVPTPRPLAPRQLDAPAILFGGVYDWYDPQRAIDAVAIARESIPNLTLTFTRHPNPHVTPQGKLAEAMQYVGRNRYHDFVKFEPWVAYEKRGEAFDRFALALITFPRSIETDLAMRTRIYDYLWAGLPIITSSAPGTDEILERYGAGSVIHEESAEAFARELVSLLRDRARYERMSQGSQQFVGDHQWTRTLEPLREFCRAPRYDAMKKLFATRSEYLLPDQRPSILARIKRRVSR
jgi:glycosyltransferase involved in cell wall biosynthesis